MLPPLLPAMAALCFDALHTLLSFWIVVRMIFGRLGLDRGVDRYCKSSVLLWTRATVPAG
jgi:hypothetical protein